MKTMDDVAKKNLRVTAVFFVAVMAAIIAMRQSPIAHAQVATPAASSSLQAQIDANDQQIASLNQQIATYQSELLAVGADKKTLQQAISALDLQRKEVEAQVSLTQRQINATQLQIQQLGGEITDSKQTIATDQAALGAQLQIFQKVGNKPLLMQLLSSDSLIETWSDMNATLEIEEAIQNQMKALQVQEGSLASSQAISKQKQATLTSQQSTLTSQQQSLVVTEQSKNQLLAETNAKEANYEKLLAAAELELNSFSAFAENAGGSKLVTGQTSCDAWGCYYNQRDAAWGNDPLDGTKYTLASDGCLVTAMAMMMTHYGYRNVTPVTINTNPDNFAAYYPAYLLSTINVNGITASRITSAIDSNLAAGNPVVVGLKAYGGTHYVVLVAGKKGNYLMRDPYVANGNNISFSSHYTTREIFSIAKVVVKG
ncbi:MAG: C39 family peptidase [Minisyncoccia bacterium]